MKHLDFGSISLMKRLDTHVVNLKQKTTSSRNYYCGKRLKTKTIIGDERCRGLSEEVPSRLALSSNYSPLVLRSCMEHASTLRTLSHAALYLAPT